MKAVEHLLASELSLVLIERREEARDIASFVFEQFDRSKLPSFEAGAHVLVEVASGMRRAYSLCGDPADRYRYTLGVQREVASRGGSIALYDHLRPGMRLQMTGPRNEFSLKEDARRSILLAGGIGVTPILAMAERLILLQADFDLHYTVRSAERAAFMHRLTSPDFAGHVQLHYDDGPAEQRFDAAAVLRGTPEQMEGTHVYICGPAGFIDSVMAAARQQGWDPAHLHREYFTPPTNDTVTTSGDNAFDLLLASTGQRIHVAPGTSAARAMLDAGLPLVTSCENGICGTCVTTVLQGQPEHRDHYLTEDDRRRNDCFIPCCSRAQSPELVIDL